MLKQVLKRQAQTLVAGIAPRLWRLRHQRLLVLMYHRILERLGRAVRLFCYPNGDASPEAQTLVARHYLEGCSTIHGWHRCDADMI